MEAITIQCPRCRYVPSQNDRWICDCGNIWNTFLTAAKCSCGKQWEDTCCPNCRRFSEHFKFYPQLSELLENEMKNLNLNKPKIEF